MKILIADPDERFIAQVLACFAQYGEGSKILTTTNGLDALRLTKKHADLDMVFANPLLPKLSGLEVLYSLWIHHSHIERWMMPLSVFEESYQAACHVHADIVEQHKLAKLLVDRKILNIALHFEPEVV